MPGMLCETFLDGSSIEDKVAFTIRIVLIKLRHYFGAYNVVVLTSHFLKYILVKLDQSDHIY